MRLTKVDIHAYRSLYDVSLVPQPFTVLVGPNNAGKTNLADSLEFLGQVARNGLEVAVGREGGFENLAFRRQRRTRKPVRFAVTARLSAEDLERFARVRVRDDRLDVEIDYAFTLEASSERRDADFRVSSESLEMRFLGRDQLSLRGIEIPRLTISRAENELRFTVPKAEQEDREFEGLIDPFDEQGFEEYVNRLLEPTSLMINRLAFNYPISAFLESLGQTRLFQLAPIECRKEGSSTPNPELERHGGNLPGVVRYMQRNHSDAWNQTFAAMRKIIPDLRSIETEFTTSRRLALLFQERGARAWNAEDVSDGTIQSLALFTCLFDPRVPFVLIEEPENSIHPWIIRVFADACREARDKQVLVTTHSPALMSYLQPDELSVLWRPVDGRTQLSPLTNLDPDAAALWEQGKIDLYDVINGGWIRETVPLGMQ